MQKKIDPFAFQSKENRLYLIIGLSLMLVAIIFGLLASGVLGMGRAVGGPVTKSGKQSAPVLPAVVEPGPGITAAPVQSSPVTADPHVVKKMPAHILDWLKHLEATERKRDDLTKQELAGLLTQMSMLAGVGGTEKMMEDLLAGDPDSEPKSPTQEIGEQGEVHHADWEGLNDFFDSVPPPNECIPIRNAYSQCLGETRAMYSEILAVMKDSGNDAKGAVANLMKMKNKSNDRIDVPGRQADRLVQEICDKYDTRKWFTVNGDIGSGLGNILNGLGGMIGR